MPVHLFPLQLNRRLCRESVQSCPKETGQGPPPFSISIICTSFCSSLLALTSRPVGHPNSGCDCWQKNWPRKKAHGGICFKEHAVPLQRPYHRGELSEQQGLTVSLVVLGHLLPGPAHSRGLVLLLSQQQPSIKRGHAGEVWKGNMGEGTQKEP